MNILHLATKSGVRKKQIMQLSITHYQLYYNSIDIANGLYIILEDLYFCILVITKIFVSFTIDKIFSFSQKQYCNILLIRLIVIIAIVCIWINNSCYNQVSVTYQQPLMILSLTTHFPIKVHSISPYPPLNKTTAMNHCGIVCSIVCWTCCLLVSWIYA